MPARPLTRLAVSPEDFPLLDNIRGHDDTIIRARAERDRDGFPRLGEGPATAGG
jgi:hypothetical protein